VPICCTIGDEGKYFAWSISMKKFSRLAIISLFYSILAMLILIAWYLPSSNYTEIATVFGLIAIGLQLLTKKAPLPEAVLSHLYSQLQESENRFRSAFDYAAIGMALLSPRGRFLKVNQSLCQILKFTEQELLNMSIRHLVHPDDFNKELPQIKRMLRGDTKTYQAVQRFFNKNGEVIWIMSSVSVVRNASRKPLHFIAQFQNISAEKRSEERLRHMAYHDPLTGLANRNRLEQHINEILTAAKRNDESFAVIILDLDFFKNINDSIGHDAGDALLQIVSERLKNTIRSKDIVARVGGDEFVIVINDVKRAEVVAQIGQKILYNLLKPIMLKGRELYITTSIGISVYPYDGQDIETLVKNADLALYRAKENGRNNYQFCTPDMAQKAQEKIERQNALSHALLQDEFVLYYQPSLDVVSQKIESVEALLRWQSKDYGFVTPDSIISLAEESGLIVPLSDWVLHTACNQVKSWQSTGFPSLKLAINLSARQFKNMDFLKNILLLLEGTHFPSHHLALEITEGLIMYDPENTLRVLSTLKAAGIIISVDDFGTGFSSFSYLTNHAVDKIKIDKSFIKQLTTDPAKISAVAAMIAMANKLGIKSVAEGVETKEQYDILVHEGCDEIQGFYIAKPLPADQMEQYLKQTSFNSSKNNV
jgi:diguanylate cyclase (GGDEF)-like protein/PAS domain S-box-containing protein